ncbi:mediator complex, subunit Med18 [Limtongia smithiae]|uniref:mediator complex, subunit Med18 n=1 Tax=Limtongia smithiae TaxID=1125753 RepID=UPI0034CFB429
MSNLQQLSLYAAIPPAKLPHVLSVLAAVTGMRAIPTAQHHIVFSPTSPLSASAHRGSLAGAGGAPLESSRIDVRRDIPLHTNRTQKDENDDGTSSKYSQWTLTIPTIPDAAKRPVQVQQISKTVFVPVKYTSDDSTDSSKAEDEANTSMLFRFLRALDYVYAYDYIERGRIFVYQGIVIISVTEIAPQSPPQLHEIPVSDGDNELVADTVARGRVIENAKFINTWIVHAYVEVLSGVDSVGDELQKMKLATDKLENLKAEVSGIVELVAPDRGLLDPRVQIRR